MKHVTSVMTALTLGAVFAGPVPGADPEKIDWSSVPARTLTLFYPAQSTFQWLSSGDHPGAGMVKTGGACVTCHKGAEEKLGNNLVRANKLEPAPVGGKNGTVQLNVQRPASRRFWVILRWKTDGERLDRPVHFGVIAQDCRSGPIQPRRA